MKSRSTFVIVCVFVVGVLGGMLLRSSGIVGPRVREAPPLPAPLTPEGQNALTPRERETFYHLSEGGELFPLDWFLALEVETMAADGGLQARPFMDNIERYGLLFDPKSPGNPYGLPVGISLARGKVLGIEMIGLNCTACHVGQVQYRNRAVRIDGGPNMVLVNKFLRDMILETEDTLKSPRRLARFWERVRAARRARRAAANAGDSDVTAPDEAFARTLIRVFTQNRGLIEAQIAGLRNVPTLKNSLAISVQEGYGRLDAFGIGRDELFGAVAGNSLPADAPVSLPHLWGMAYTGWLQWGANTNSVMERNIGQALGVGAFFDRNFRSTVRIDNLHQMEDLAYKLQPPAWPEFFPAVDGARAERGRALFTQLCAGCHETWEQDGLIRTYQLHSLDEVGTDPLVAIGFERPVRQADGSVLPFAYAARDLITKIKEKAYEERGLDAQAIAALEQRHIRRGPQWDPTFRATLLDSEKYADSKGRKVYRSKTLVGIWATAPYLHNGSVPTLYDLLKAVADRPVTFPTGQREYDPVKLGLQTNPSNFTLPAGLEPFVLDTRIAGNWNTGHEWSFYPTLTDEMRFAIIEYLKTHTEEYAAAAAAPAVGAAAATAPTLTVAPGAPGPIRAADAGSGWRLSTLAALLGAGLVVALLVRSLSANAARHSATEAADIHLRAGDSGAAVPPCRRSGPAAAPRHAREGPLLQRNVRGVRRHGRGARPGARDEARPGPLRQAWGLSSDRPVRQWELAGPAGSHRGRARVLVRSQAAAGHDRSRRRAARFLDEQRDDLPDQRRACLRGHDPGGECAQYPEGLPVARARRQDGVRADRRPGRAAITPAEAGVPADALLEHGAVLPRLFGRHQVLGDAVRRQSGAAARWQPQLPSGRVGAPRDPR